jgi:hypothetical protein
VSSRWNHAICERDWINQKGTWESAPEFGADAVVLVEFIRPVVLRDPVLERCCFCGEPMIFGAYVRQDPAELACKGGHALASPSPPSTYTSEGSPTNVGGGEQTQ